MVLELALEKVEAKGMGMAESMVELALQEAGVVAEQVLVLALEHTQVEAGSTQEAEEPVYLLAEGNLDQDMDPHHQLKH